MVNCVAALMVAASSLAAEPLLLKGFTLVDPANRRARVADLFIDGENVAPSGRAASDCRVIEGHGRFLIPALWDMKASLWGNESGKDYHELYQDLGISQSLRVQLYYGVAHVAGAHLDRDWVKRELLRADAMQFPAAGLIYPDKTLGAGDCKIWGCFPVSVTAAVVPLLDDLKSKDVPFVQVSYIGPAGQPLPGVSKSLLELIIKAAHQRGMKVWVTFETWGQAAEALGFGADLLHGMGEGEAPAALMGQLRANHGFFSPRLAYFLEPSRLVGHAEALADPFLADSVPKNILDSFRNPAEIWEGWNETLAFGTRNEKSILGNVKRMADAGVMIVSSTDAGWSLGTFHGYSTHTNQAWMEKAGLDPWTRLRSATEWPAHFIGRSVGFQTGADADFVALDGDPLKGADQLRTISFLIRKGQVVERDSLKPDMTRTKFSP